MDYDYEREQTKEVRSLFCIKGGKNETGRKNISDFRCSEEGTGVIPCTEILGGGTEASDQKK